VNELDATEKVFMTFVEDKSDNELPLTSMEKDNITPREAHKVPTGKELNTINAYPNPFTGDLILEFPAEQEGLVFIHLIDVLGQTVLQKEVVVVEGLNKVNLQVHNALTTRMVMVNINFTNTTQASLQTRLIQTHNK
jgi:hypothetical protein